jgi:hypothetical protein
VKKDKPYLVIGKRAGDLNFNDYIDIFSKYGVIVFKNFFQHDPIYINYKKDIKNLCDELAKKNSLVLDKSDSVNKIITKISNHNRKEVGFLYDLGTRPIKLLSGTILKVHPDIVKIINLLMPNCVVGFPYQGETLHIFPPGQENYKYNLPMHQDYPYIMQSPHQVTAYINIGELQEKGNGGIRVRLESHKDGISPSIASENNLRITANKNYYEENYISEEFFFDDSDFAIFDSLIQHEGIQNHSDCTRIVQLIRYSNLNNQTSINYGWKSSEMGSKRGIEFIDAHPDLLQ